MTNPSTAKKCRTCRYWFNFEYFWISPLSVYERGQLREKPSREDAGYGRCRLTEGCSHEPEIKSTLAFCETSSEAVLVTQPEFSCNQYKSEDDGWVQGVARLDLPAVMTEDPDDYSGNPEDWQGLPGLTPPETDEEAM